MSSKPPDMELPNGAALLLAKSIADDTSEVMADDSTRIRKSESELRRPRARTHARAPCNTVILRPNARASRGRESAQVSREVSLSYGGVS
jgi:hypothetical protein